MLIRFEVHADGPMDDSSLQAALVGLVLARPDGTLVPQVSRCFSRVSAGRGHAEAPAPPAGSPRAAVAGQLAIKNSQGEELERLPLPTVIRW